MLCVSQPKSITSLPLRSLCQPYQLISPLLNNSPSLHPFIISSFSTGNILFLCLSSLLLYFPFFHCSYVLLYLSSFLLVPSTFLSDTPFCFTPPPRSLLSCFKFAALLYYPSLFPNVCPHPCLTILCPKIDARAVIKIQCFLREA